MAAATRTVFLLSGLSSFVIIGAGAGIFGPAVPVFEAQFGLTTATAGWLVSTLWLGCLSGTVLMYFKGALVSPRFPLAMMALGSVILALAPLWSVALLGAVVYGLGYGSVAALFNPRVLTLYRETGASKVGMLNALYSVGAILAPYAFTLVGSDLRPVFWAMAAVSALTWAGSGSIGLAGLAPEAHGRGFRPHLPILGLAALAIGIEASLAGLGPSALIRSGVSEQTAALLLSLFFVAQLATRIVLIFVTDRLPDFAIFVTAVALAAVCALGAALISPAIFFPPMGVAAGLFFQGEYVTATRKMGDDPRVSPVILAVGLVGAIVSPPIYARFMDALGPHGFFWLVAGVATVTTALSLASYRAMMR